MLLLALAQFLKPFIAKHGKSIAIGLAWGMFLVGIIQKAVSSLTASFAKLLASFTSFDAFKGVNFSGLDFIGYVNAMIPLSEFVGLMTIYLTAWTLVIIFRWIKSLIPTWSN